MANNRMYIICLHCLNDETTSIDNCRHYIAKYYPPPTGWYTTREEIADGLNAFFNSHQHKETWEQSMWGGHFTITTESLMRGSDSMVSSKRDVLEVVSKAIAEGKAGH